MAGEMDEDCDEGWDEEIELLRARRDASFYRLKAFTDDLNMQDYMRQSRLKSRAAPDEEGLSPAIYGGIIFPFF